MAYYYTKLAMNKLVLSFLILCVSFSSLAQINIRMPINGVIKASINDEVEGIVVFNRATNRGTITNQNGEFKIVVGVGDRVEIVAMQFQKFTVVVDKGIVESKSMSVFLNETVNQLDEVVVTPYDLSGNIKADVNRVALAQDKGLEEVIKETQDKINDADYDFKPDELTPVKNTVFLEDRMINGLNFVNLFKLAFNKRKENESKLEKDIDVKMRKVYNDDFFSNVLLLEKDQINDFIFYAEDRGLDETYFKEGKELDLLEFLVYQSKQYLGKQ